MSASFVIPILIVILFVSASRIFACPAHGKTVSLQLKLCDGSTVPNCDFFGGNCGLCTKLIPKYVNEVYHIFVSEPKCSCYYCRDPVRIYLWKTYNNDLF